MCCFNSEKVISDTLKSLLAQKLHGRLSIELIIVDNNSKDNTVSIAKEVLRNAWFDYLVVAESNSGIMHARRKGVASSNGEIVIFVDDDNRLNDDWINRCVSVFNNHPNVGCVGGLNLPDLVIHPPIWFSEYCPSYACGPQADRPGLVSFDRMSLFGAGLAFRAHLLKDILFHGADMFLIGRTKNKLLRGDDSELCMRSVLLGSDLYYDPHLILKHCIQENRVNWKYVMTTRFGGGIASLVLDMYSLAIKGEKIPSYSALVKLVLAQCYNNKEDILLSFFSKPGDRRCFNGMYLRGRLYGLYMFGPGKITHIRKQIELIRKRA